MTMMSFGCCQAGIEHWREAWQQNLQQQQQQQQPHTSLASSSNSSARQLAVGVGRC
jgi:hypothetical protein